MARHQFMIDFLRPELTVDNLVQSLTYKRELDTNDLDEIIANSKKVMEAARIRKIALSLK